MHLHGGGYPLFANPILVHLGVLASWREFMFSQLRIEVSRFGHLIAVCPSCHVFVFVKSVSIEMKGVVGAEGFEPPTYSV